MAINKIKITVFFPVFILLLASLAVQAAGKLYRYKNMDGIVVIEDRIPPEYVAGGYDILNRQGRVIERVPGKTERSEVVGEPLTLAVQPSEDRFLLKSFSRVEEIESARNRKLRLLSRELAILDKNIQDIELSKKQLQKTAANLQRSGREPSEKLVNELSLLEKRREEAAKMRALRQGERNRVEDRYNAYIERFKILSSDTAQ